ncbi:FAS-associated death domain protein [Aplochiton taeniatus]
MNLEFKKVLLQISNEIGSQLEPLKFLCKGFIGKGRLEKIDTGFKLFEVLMERNKLSLDDTEYLCSLLTDVGRLDLVDILKDRTQAGNIVHPTEEPGDVEKAKLDIAAHVVAERLGKNWRKLARKLGLAEVKLDSISKKHPFDLEETTLELIREWRKGQGAQARADNLLGALRACDQNLTADIIEKKILQAYGP